MRNTHVDAESELLPAPREPSSVPRCTLGELDLYLLGNLEDPPTIYPPRAFSTALVLF